MKKFAFLTLALALTFSMASLAWGHGWHGRGGRHYDRAAYGNYGHGYHNGYGGGPCWWWNSGQAPAANPQGYAPQQPPAQQYYPAPNMPNGPQQNGQPVWNGPQR